VRAGVRQQHRDALVDDGRDRTRGPLSVPAPRLPSGSPGLRNPRRFRERRRLPLGRPLRLLKRRGQTLHFLLQTVSFAAQVRILTVQFAALATQPLDLLAQLLRSPRGLL
jgi:hypothetical protein